MISNIFLLSEILDVGILGAGICIFWAPVFTIIEQRMNTHFARYVVDHAGKVALWNWSVL